MKLPLPRDRRLLANLRRFGIPEVPSLGACRMVDAEEDLPPHTHAGCMEIHCIKRGSPVFMVGGRLHRLRGGDLFVTWPEEVHDTGLAALRLLRDRARSAGKRLTVIDASRHDYVAQKRASTTAVVPRAAGHFPWALPAQAHGASLQRATSRIATPGRHGAVTRGTPFPRAPVAAQAGTV